MKANSSSAWLPGSSFACSCGRAHSIATYKIESGDGALGRLAPFLRDALPSGSKALCVYDSNTFAVAGARLRKELPGSGEFVFKKRKGDLPADMASLAELEEGLKKAAPSVALAVGSGVVSDLVKVAADSLRIPYVSVPTAASMDGYLSANAALLSGGMKRQFNGLRPPLAVFSETELAASAPERMTRAGLGDALGKFSSLAEWRINGILRGEPFCQEAISLLEDEILELLSVAETEPLSSKALSERLMRTLLLTGMAMQATGSSAPASCGEHYVSHVLEMRGYALHGHAPSFHGLQVAWGAAAVMKAYAFLREASFVKRLDLAAMRASYASHVDDWKAIGVDVARSVEGKTALLEALGPRLDCLESCREPVSWLLGFAKRLDGVYARLGLPRSPAELGISKEDALFALLRSVDIRQRVCVFDLLHCLGGMKAFASAMELS